VLAVRANMLAAARRFFLERTVMEVETPTLVSHPVTDRHLHNIACELRVGGHVRRYLHTSPEFHMKRLLAAGAGDVYQICRAYRDGESGAVHLPEFTLIEWYRRNFGSAAMIAETCDLIATVAAVAGRQVGDRVLITYAALLGEEAGVDVRRDPATRIRERALELLGRSRTAALGDEQALDRDFWLDLLMAEHVQPRLRGRGLVVIDRYPASQASLARLSPDDPAESERFEVFLDGIELANGYHELSDPMEQRRRFEEDRRWRRRAGLPDAPVDPALLAALAEGLPDCSGVAVGFDRLVMAALGRPRIAEVVAFTPADL
jgi:lysyl-tRNA synthetase class 2